MQNISYVSITYRIKASLISNNHSPLPTFTFPWMPSIHASPVYTRGNVRLMCFSPSINLRTCTRTWPYSWQKSSVAWPWTLATTCNRPSCCIFWPSWSDNPRWPCHWWVLSWMVRTTRQIWTTSITPVRPCWTWCSVTPGSWPLLAVTINTTSTTMGTINTTSSIFIRICVKI